MPYGLCTVPGCNTPAVSKLDLCTKHGGTGQCSIVGCHTSAATRTNKLCVAHGGGSKRVECTVPGCTTASQANGLCKKHSPKKFCDTLGCPHVQRSKGICKACAQLKEATDTLTELQEQKEREDLENALKGAAILAQTAKGGFFSDMTLS
jgi:hypothetical protein